MSEESEYYKAYYSEEELVAASPSQRNWKGIAIAILVILVVCSLIVTAVIIMTPPDEGPRVKGRRLQLSDILGDELSPRGYNGSWVSPTELLYRDDSGALVLLNVIKLSLRTLMPNNTFRKLNADYFSVSPDLRYVLLRHDMTPVFRYSFNAKYSIYDVEKGSDTVLTPVPDVPHFHPHLQFAEWTSQGNGIVIVYNNDIYYKPRAEQLLISRITYNGEENTIYNGIPDWLYEEEVLHDNNAIWVSQDNRMMLFATFNETLVDKVHFPIYGNVENTRSNQYPRYHSIPYPKAGRTNPSVTLTVVLLNSSRNMKRFKLDPPIGIKDRDHYFTSVQWINSDMVSVVWMNREQNISVVSLCRSPGWTCTESHSERSGERGWINMIPAPLFSHNRDNYLILAPIMDGDHGTFTHINVVNIAKKRITPLTHGQYVVTEILGWDENNNEIYYIGVPQNKPGERHLYKVSDLNARHPRHNKCLTCHPNNIVNCSYVSADFSPTYDHYVLECLGPDVPTTDLVYTRENRVIMRLQNNSAIKELLMEIAMPQIKTFQVAIQGDDVAHVRLFLPPGLLEEEMLQYPVVVETYAGPGTQLVSEAWKLHWGSYLSSQKDFIYVWIDGRGSGYLGDARTQLLHLNLGTIEVEDQISVTKYLVENLPFINENKVALWGGSYGGYVTIMALAKDKDNVFECGVTVAPVTNWLLYDSVYTERYMGSPNLTGNYKGYEQGDVTKYAGNLKDKKFFVIHGSADDNVQLQHSMLLSKALIREGVLFRLLIYPDENHGLSGVKYHFFQSMESFFDECFKNAPVEVEDEEEMDVAFKEKARQHEQQQLN